MKKIVLETPRRKKRQKRLRKTKVETHALFVPGGKQKVQRKKASGRTGKFIPNDGLWTRGPHKTKKKQVSYGRKRIKTAGSEFRGQSTHSSRSEKTVPEKFR